SAADEITRLDLRGSDEAVDRGVHTGVAEIERGGVNGGPPRLHLSARRVLRAACVVELLLADGALRRERRVTRHVVGGSVEARLRGVEIGLRFRESSLKRLWIDPVEEVTLADERTLAEIHALEKPFDACADIDVL